MSTNAQTSFWPSYYFDHSQKWRPAKARYLKNEDWRLIAEDICSEKDPAKLTLLVDLLCRALDGESDATPLPERQKENAAEPFPDAPKP